MASELPAAHLRGRTHAPKRALLFGGKRRFFAATRTRRGQRTRLRLFITRALRLVAALLILSLVATTAAFAYLYSHYSKIVDRRLASGYLTSRAGIYAAPRVLRPGQRISAGQLSLILRRAGYAGGEASRVWNGRFRQDEDGAVEIRPNDAGDEASAQDFGVVRVRFDRRGQIASLEGDGAPLESYTLAPEPLTADAAEKTAERSALSYDEIPPALARAILSIEDRRFFEHGPLDLWGIARAAFSWGEEEQDFKQGGSTITQQLVKNTYLTPERTLRRKFHEAALASVIESRMSKRDIFALYCNEIYLGRRGSISVRGVRQAARVFFGKELGDLTLAEGATVAGMIQSPARYAPDRHPDAARARRNAVLAAMLRDGAITQDEARAAAAEPVVVAPPARADAVAPYFIDYASRFVESRQPSVTESGRALRVYTTLDLDLQQAAEESIKNQLDRLEKVFKGKKRPQAALVALDPRDGRVLAMVGGDSYAESQLNRATDALRQPGSVFKPVVYAAAIESGISPLTLSTDAPREFTYDGNSKYRPANYGGAFSMRDVTLRTGLVRSLNVVTVDAALRTGLTRVAALAERLGLPRPQAYPSLALGTTEATPLEVAAAYTAFAGGGRVARPNPLLRVEAAGSADVFGEGDTSALVGSGALEADGGLSLEANAPDAAQVLKPSTAYMMTDMLAAVVDHGTARAARGAIRGVAVAGKTGTSRDGWFAGFTPNLVCVVWVGFDDGEELNLTGAESALPAWVEFVRRAVELRPELGGQSFERPASIATVEIDPETGLLASASCPQRERVAVAPGFVPDHECSLHGDPWGLRALAEDAPPVEQTPTTQTAEARTTDEDLRDAVEAFYTQPTRAPHAARHDAGATPIETGVGEEWRASEAGRATHVVIGRDGRRRLTNDLTVSLGGDGRRSSR
jgi:penicillin-binding protein 1B